MVELSDGSRKRKAFSHRWVMPTNLVAKDSKAMTSCCRWLMDPWLTSFFMFYNLVYIVFFFVQQLSSRHGQLESDGFGNISLFLFLRRIFFKNHHPPFSLAVDTWKSDNITSSPSAKWKSHILPTGLINFHELVTLFVIVFRLLVWSAISMWASCRFKRIEYRHYWKKERIDLANR